MKLAIVGYGKMGRMIDRLAPEYGFETRATIDVGQEVSSARGCDVAIEFTEPSAAVPNLLQLAEMRIPAVCGTTGWFGDLPRVREAVENTGSALVYSPNFSIGVNVFIRVVAEAARLFANEAEYEAWAWEIHHSTKKDASGTLGKLVAGMKAAGFTRTIDMSSNRAGRHPGTHEIGFDSSADTITLRHTARSREGFARGALKAAKWVAGKQGVWEFSEVLFGR